MDRTKQGLLPALLLLLAGVSAASGLSGLLKRGQSAIQANVRPAAEIEEFDSEPIQPIPEAIELDARKVELGRRLFHDPRLSADNSVSCDSCHSLHRNGADDHVTSVGIGGAKGVVNTPTVFNSG